MPLPFRHGIKGLRPFGHRRWEHSLQKWLVAIVKDGSELALAASLSADLGFDSYAPSYRRWRKLAKHVARKEGRTRELITDSLLLGYIFVRLDMSDNTDLAALLKVKGVYGVISNLRGPCYARDSDVESLRAIERSGIHDAKPRAAGVRRIVEVVVPASPKQVADAMRSRLENLNLVDMIGKVVSLTSGPFSGMCGKVAEVRGDHAKIDLSMLSVTAPLRSISLSQ